MVIDLSDPCKYVGVEGEKCDKLHRLLESNPCPIPGRAKKRAPSTYNLYVKECIKAKGGIRKFGEAAPIMRECAGEYKEDKRKGAFRYKFEVPAVQTGGEQPVLWKGRDMQKEWSDLYGKISGARKK